jgi:hypothetical protein
MAYGGQGNIAQRIHDQNDDRWEAQARFDREFDEWRIRRGEQRAAVGRTRARMEVVGSDGGHVGIVDCTSGDRIVLATSGSSDRAIPCGWIEKVEQKVVLNIAAAEARSRPDGAGFGHGLQSLNRSLADVYPDEY